MFDDDGSRKISSELKRAFLTTLRFDFYRFFEDGATVFSLVEVSVE
jgi:hypothetical protein